MRVLVDRDLAVAFLNRLGMVDAATWLPGKMERVLSKVPKKLITHLNPVEHAFHMRLLSILEAGDSPSIATKGAKNRQVRSVRPERDRFGCIIGSVGNLTGSHLNEEWQSATDLAKKAGLFRGQAYAWLQNAAAAGKIEYQRVSQYRLKK
ncbi:MAG: hypothetical protein Unbinned3891contig1000_19 [Prokaryotic dsDNA virus sp.]|mgnify:CR=1 FL=1|nr:MAG: hypothetical protein Unbinned3891contig1000_19 [Prokaryotic dsDNA virus sp.]|tara:strand:- start:14115 stop:14564 length:450 start_codon:yes stop_codon:yes gene_type:complete